MKIITEPTVTVIAKSQFLETDRFEIPDDGNDAVKLGAFAAKVCYDSVGKEGRPNEENQRAVLSHMHGSVLEHATVSLFIEGITRGLTLELNRHRTFAISQRSTRYTAEEDAAIVLEPYYSYLYERHKEDILLYDKEKYFYVMSPDNKEATLVSDFLNHCINSFTEYKYQVEQLETLNPLQLEGFELRKWARGKARNALPHALETRGTWTNNHRGWRWFIESRSDRHAEPEIRRLAFVIYEQLSKIAPLYYEDFSIADVYDNIPVLVPQYSKV